MAQKDTATLTSTIASELADNEAGAITEGVMRGLMEDVRDSFFNIADNPTQGLSTEDFTSTEKSKLSGIATSATANSTDAQLRDRSTHTGSQEISTITDLSQQLLYDAVYSCHLTHNSGGGGLVAVDMKAFILSPDVEDPLFTWSRTGAGTYLLTFSDTGGTELFTINKTAFFFTPSEACFYDIVHTSGTTITLRIYDTDGTLADDMITKANFKVEVYK